MLFTHVLKLSASVSGFACIESVGMQLLKGCAISGGYSVPYPSLEMALSLLNFALVSVIPVRTAFVIATVQDQSLPLQIRHISLRIILGKGNWGATGTKVAFHQPPFLTRKA